MRPMRSWSTASLLVVTLLLAACQADEHALDGTQWKLVAWSVSASKATDFEITAQFADGRIVGKSAVNRYSGSYQTGPRSTFATGQIAGTMMAGPEPEMRAEQAYLALLAQARSFKATPDKLALLDAGGSELLVYAPE